MKKKDDFCRESNHFLKSVCLALCLISSGGSAVYAATLQTEQTTLTVRMNNCTIKDVFDHIEKNSEFVFVYHGANIDLHRRVNFDVRDKSVEVILERLFKGTDVEYIINNRQIIVRRNEKKENSSLSIQQAKKITVTGIVKDTHGEPLIGVNVLVKGSRTGTITDMDGHFLLNEVSPNAMVSISYIGYKTEEIALNNRSSLTITLTEDSEQLDEVVVVGYGTQKKGEVASAISSIKSENFIKTPSTDPAQLIKGQVPGLSIITPDANPTSTSEISLRGITTLKASASPLVLIDGIPGDLNSVSPDDIQQIDVLKDGSAAAIYGTRGTNGVILITTKNTLGEMPTEVDVNAYISTQQIIKRLPFMNADEYRQRVKEGVAGAQDDGATTDWLDQVTRTPFTQIYNISLRGGSRTTNYVASFEYRALDWETDKSIR